MFEVFHSRLDVREIDGIFGADKWKLRRKEVSHLK